MQSALRLTVCGWPRPPQSVPFSFICGFVLTLCLDCSISLFGVDATVSGYFERSHLQAYSYEGVNSSVTTIKDATFIAANITLDGGKFLCPWLPRCIYLCIYRVGLD